jgi:hypothetical protein
MKSFHEIRMIIRPAKVAKQPNPTGMTNCRKCKLIECCIAVIAKSEINSLQKNINMAESTL